MRILLGFVAAAAALLTAAQAEITKAQVDRLVEARNLRVLDVQPDTVVVLAPTGDQIAIGLLDELGDGRKSVLAFLAIYENQGQLSPAAFNQWNAMATYKGFLIENRAALMQVNTAIGELPDETIAGAWDMFVAETQNFRGFLYAGMLGRSATLIGPGPDPKQMFDAGLARSEIAARDNAFTASLNRAPTQAAKPFVAGLTLTEAQKRLLGDDSPLAVNKP